MEQGFDIGLSDKSHNFDPTSSASHLKTQKSVSESTSKNSEKEIDVNIEKGIAFLYETLSDCKIGFLKGDIHS